MTGWLPAGVRPPVVAAGPGVRADPRARMRPAVAALAWLAETMRGPTPRRLRIGQAAVVGVANDDTRWGQIPTIGGIGVGVPVLGAATDVVLRRGRMT